MSRRRPDRKTMERLIPPVLEQMAGGAPVPPGEWEEILRRIRREHPDAASAAGRLLPWPDTRLPLLPRLAAGGAMIASVLFLSLISLFPDTLGEPFLPGRDLTVGRILEIVTPPLTEIQESIQSCFRQENQ